MKKTTTEKILSETRQIYDQIAPAFAQTRNKWWHAFGDFAKYAKDGDNILDLGCGNGRMADLFKDKYINYLGVDNSKELIKIATERFKTKDNIKFTVGEATALDFLANQFDLILMMAVLHHLPNKQLRQKVISDLYRILKPNSRLVLSNWNLWQLGYYKKYWPKLLNYCYKSKRGVWSLWDAFIPWKPIGEEHQRYVHSFTLRELKRLLRSAGFEIEYAGYENMGEKANFFNGYNSIVVARKK